MSDYLVNLGEKAWFRKTVSTLNIPLPLPQALERASGPEKVESLTGKAVLLRGKADTALATALDEAGAVRPAESGTIHGLVYDARDIRTIAELEHVYAFFHVQVKRLATNGRVVLIARAESADTDPEAVAASTAILGFTKSIAKEVGRKGATANAIFVADGAGAQILGPLRFFLSPRSAFVDGQSITLSTPGKAKKGKTAWANSLAGKTALVTGAARGIGEATARRLREEGAQVIALDMGNAETELNALAKEIGAVPLMLDITAPNAVAEILKAAKELGGLDIVINNAGITRDKTIGNMSEELWRLALNVNLKAALDISLGALDGMKEGGRVVCLSSIAGIAGNFGQTNYAAAKSGLIGAVHAMAPLFAEKGATVNAVAPGFIETRLTAAIPLATREGGRRLSNLGQGGLPVDVAELITFLATPGAAGINGQLIRACGGNYIGA